MAHHKTEILNGSRSGLRDRKICDGRRLFGRRRGQEMEMELKARAKGPKIALSLGYDWFGKGASLAHGNDALLPGHVADDGQENGVAKRGTVRRPID